MARSVQLKRKLKEVRRRYREAEKEGHASLSAFRIFDAQQKQLTGVEKGGTLGKVRGKAQEEQLERLVDRFLNAKWTTSKGRKQIWRESKRTLKAGGKFGQYGEMSEREYLRYIDILENEILNKVIESGALSSGQVIEYTHETTAYNKRVQSEGGARTKNLETILMNAYDHFAEQGIHDATAEMYQEYISNELRIT